MEGAINPLLVSVFHVPSGLGALPAKLVGSTAIDRVYGGARSPWVADLGSVKSAAKLLGPRS